MTWDKLTEQATACHLLQNSLASGRVAHAYLFLGPDTKSKTKAARLLAQALNCEMGAPCTTCQSCQLIASGSHPDVQVLAPDGRFLRLDQMRELCRRAGNTPLVGRTKVYIVLEAEKLLPEAANHLLKTLEEPPSDTVFILCAEHRQTLLPTIVSRCQEVWFRPLTPKIAAQRLQEEGCNPRQAHLAAYLAAGDLATAKAWADEDAAEKWEQFAGLVEKLPQGKAALFQAAETFAQAPEQFLPLLQSWYRDLLAWRVGARQDIYHRGKEEALDQMAFLYDPKELVRCSQIIEKTNQLIFGRIRVNVRLALEAMLVQLIPGQQVLA